MPSGNGCGDLVAVIFTRKFGNVLFVGEKSSFDQARQEKSRLRSQKIVRVVCLD
jgi:hypothetical protein